MTSWPSYKCKSRVLRQFFGSQNTKKWLQFELWLSQVWWERGITDQIQMWNIYVHIFSGSLSFLCQMYCPVFYLWQMLLRKLLIKHAIVWQRSHLRLGTFCTVMIHRAPIQPLKDKLRPNWAVAESMINNGRTLIVNQIIPSRGQESPPLSCLISHCLHLYVRYLKLHPVYERVGTVASPVN